MIYTNTIKCDDADNLAHIVRMWWENLNNPTLVKVEYTVMGPNWFECSISYRAE